MDITYYKQKFPNLSDTELQAMAARDAAESAQVAGMQAQRFPAYKTERDVAQAQAGMLAAQAPADVVRQAEVLRAAQEQRAQHQADVAGRMEPWNVAQAERARMAAQQAEADVAMRPTLERLAESTGRYAEAERAVAEQERQQAIEAQARQQAEATLRARQAAMAKQRAQLVDQVRVQQPSGWEDPSQLIGALGSATAGMLRRAPADFSYQEKQAALARAKHQYEQENDPTSGLSRQMQGVLTDYVRQMSGGKMPIDLTNYSYRVLREQNPHLIDNALAWWKQGQVPEAPKPTGGIGKKKETDDERRNLGFFERAKDSATRMDQALPNFIPTTITKYKPDVLKTEDEKLFESLATNFITSVLRKESGASISPTEYDNEYKKYFPLPGDTAAVIAEKKSGREAAIRNLMREGGNAFYNSYGLDPSDKGAWEKSRFVYQRDITGQGKTAPLEQATAGKLAAGMRGPEAPMVAAAGGRSAKPAPAETAAQKATREAKAKTDALKAAALKK